MLIDAREVWLKDGQKLVLRSPVEVDAAALLVMLKTVNSESYRNLNHASGAWNDFPLEKEEGILRTFASSDSRFMISAFAEDGRIVGNIGVFGIEDSVFLKHSARIGMGIRDEYKNRGLGTQLMRTAMFEAKAKGFHRLELTVRTFNRLGIALYEKVGFERIGRLREVALIDGEYHDEYSYDLILNP
jgi:RimJ/RimL family protein N-acetyltransferase